MGIDYQDSRDPKWTRAVYDAIVDGTMTLEVRDGDTVTVTVSGQCPRCHDQFTDVDILRAAVGLGDSATLGVEHCETVTRQLPPATLRCTCTAPHRNRRGEKTGCGIRFSVIVTSGTARQNNG